MPAPSNTQVTPMLASDRELDNILTSGEIASIYLGGVLPENKVLTKGDITATGDIERIDKQLSVRSDHTTDNVDTILDPGIYLVQNNLPGGESSGTLTVRRFDGNSDLEQTLQGYSGKIYDRRYSGSWNSWLETPTSELLEGINTNAGKHRFTNADGINIDTITKEGIYEVDTNLPPGFTNISELNVIYFNNNTIDPNRVIQRCFDLETGEIVERVASDYTNPSWSAWVTINVPNIYEFDSKPNTIIQTDVYQRLTTLDYAGVPGVYELEFSFTFNYNATGRSAFFRWTIDGTNWEEFAFEPKDITDVRPFTYAFPYTLTQGNAIQMRLEAKCENASDTLDVKFANSVLERKK